MDITTETIAPYVYLFLHIPKCAGTTVIQHLHRHLGDRRVWFPSRIRGMRQYVTQRKYVLGPDKTDVDQIVALSGQWLGQSALQFFPGRPSRPIALLRDPLSRLVSHYNHFCRWHMARSGERPATTFENWYATQRPNYMTEKFLTWYLEFTEWSVFAMSEQRLFDLANAALRQFWYVADFRSCDWILGTVSRELGISTEVEWKNVAPQKYFDADEISTPLRSTIMAQNRVDHAIYDMWKGVGFVCDAPTKPSLSLSRNSFKLMTKKISRVHAKALLKINV